MNEQQWAGYLRLPASHDTPIPSACVGCWYEQHTCGEAFPGEVKPPDTLLQRRCA